MVVWNVQFQEVWRAVTSEPPYPTREIWPQKRVLTSSERDNPNRNPVATRLPFEVGVDLSTLSLWSEFHLLKIKADQDIDVWKMHSQEVWRAVTSKPP